MIMRKEYYQHLKEQYSEDGEEALERFRGEVDYLARSRRDFFVTRGQPRSRWKESDGEREDVLISFLADIEASKQAVLAEKTALKKASKNANDERYKKHRQQLKEVASVSQTLWRNGSILMHHQMKKYLIEEYQDKAGKYPFLNLPEKAILETCKKVLLEMNRTDLISGRKK
jgi:hypothetical protein